MMPIWHVKRWKKQEKVATHPESARGPVLASLRGETLGKHLETPMPKGILELADSCFVYTCFCFDFFIKQLFPYVTFRNTCLPMSSNIYLATHPSTPSTYSPFLHVLYTIPTPHASSIHSPAYPPPHASISSPFHPATNILTHSPIYPLPTPSFSHQSIYPSSIYPPTHIFVVVLVSPWGHKKEDSIPITIYTGKTDAEVETPILWPPDAKNRLI